MPKKPRSSRARRRMHGQPTPARPRQMPAQGPEVGAAPPTGTSPPTAASPRRGQPGLDLSYVSGDLRRIIVLAAIVLVLLIILSLVLR